MSYDTSQLAVILYGHCADNGGRQTDRESTAAADQTCTLSHFFSDDSGTLPTAAAGDLETATVSTYKVVREERINKCLSFFPSLFVDVRPVQYTPTTVARNRRGNAIPQCNNNLQQ